MSVSTCASNASVVSPDVYMSASNPIKDGASTYETEIAQLLEGRIHTLLHDQQFLLLLLDLPGEISILLIEFGKQIVNLHLFGLLSAQSSNSHLPVANPQVR